MQTLSIKSPKATQVKNVVGAPDRFVQAGDALIELFDYEELKLISTIQRSIEENASKLQEVTGPRVEKKIGHLKEISNQRQAALKPTEDNYRGLVLRAGLQNIGDWLPLRAKHFVAMRTYQNLQAKVELEIYKRNVTDSKSVLEVVDALLHKELEYMEGIRSRLNIKAPRSGHFKCTVAVGDPVPIGYVLGTIE